MRRPVFKLPLGLYRVAGESMAPTYHDGDLLLGWRGAKPRQNGVVVAHHDRILIKRLIRIDDHGYWLEGDNAAASTDSRSFGYIEPTAVEATILARLARSR